MQVSTRIMQRQNAGQWTYQPSASRSIVSPTDLRGIDRIRCKRVYRNGIWSRTCWRSLGGLSDHWWGPWAVVGGIITGVVGLAWYLTPPPRASTRSWHR